MDDAPRLVSMTNVNVLSRIRTIREQHAFRLMQADAVARDRARKAVQVAAASLARAQDDRIRGEQQYYRDLACNASVAVDALYRGQDQLDRLAEAVTDANRLAEAASATLLHCEQALLRSTAEYRARSREVRKLHLLQEKLENAIRAHFELTDELDTEEQSSIRYSNKPSAWSERQ
ncbi:YscO family type III secretion system apparatus protein [Bradyrhizobium sp. WSM 1738]|uniref:YscO family type III secretion system apparatus protein n=1 Tax=Bradyrhizobium hereditatis TaxID=2821405 RepID=UPI001CE2BBD4|nr:YscO family type III secretion system apparatus protein [Bradyrhizobium hereditatis]MCA6116459.1 YscO family type III secretion system apparatus protein [Bradyrhizobium hereditatis]